MYVYCRFRISGPGFRFGLIADAGFGIGAMPHYRIEVSMTRPVFSLQLPAWLEAVAPPAPHALASAEDRMRFVVGLSRLNVRHGTGGPFAAAIFRADDATLLAPGAELLAPGAELLAPGAELLAPGVNLVLSGRCSVLHAEIVAIMAAQLKTGDYDLSSARLPSYELVTSTEPCAMCMGAVTWSGIRRLVCGARGADAEAAGFDEGAKPAAWVRALQRRGISVLRDVCREEAAAVLEEYGASGGPIYNPHRSNPDY